MDVDGQLTHTLITAVLGNLAKKSERQILRMRDFSHSKSMAIFAHVQKLMFRFFARFPKTAVHTKFLTKPIVQ